MNEPAITATDLAKSFRGGVIAVNGLDLTVPRGSVYGLIGRNSRSASRPAAARSIWRGWRSGWRC